MFAREKHLLKKKVKYKKNIHIKSKWITNRILKTFNTKEKLNETPIQSCIIKSLSIIIDFRVLVNHMFVTCMCTFVSSLCCATCVT